MKKKVKSNSRKKSSPQGRPKSFRTVKGTGSGNHGTRSRKKKKERISFPSLKPWKVILSAIILGAMGLIYLNHVFATEQLLREVQELERQYEQANRVHDDYKLTYERMIGPAEIYEVAKQQGFINGGPAEKIIEVEK